METILKNWDIKMKKHRFSTKPKEVLLRRDSDSNIKNFFQFVNILII